MNSRKTMAQFSSEQKLVAPSILAADFSILRQEIEKIEAAGADIVHVDIMDGHFVPNLTIGPPVVTSLRPVTDLPFDVHLMLDNPEQFVEPFVESGADNITVHTEIPGDVRNVLSTIRNAGCSAGLCVKPNTPGEDVRPYLDLVDMVLVMTVEPGFGGQSFQETMLPKISCIRDMIREKGLNVHIEVDGGIKANTAPLVKEAGANVLVAGTSVFRAETSSADAISELRIGS